MPLNKNIIWLVLLICLSFNLSSLGRSQWDIQHPNPLQTTRQSSGGVQPPDKLPGNFWQTGLLSRTNCSVPQGVVLTGILENDLSSAKSQAGDTFAITLEDGYIENGQVILPPYSKIIGVVNKSVSAKYLRSGQPGQLQVSLQSLVLPNGTHLAFYGFIDSNPNHAFAKQAKKRHPGTHLADYGEQATGMLLSFTSGLGNVLARRYKGLEFSLEAGEVLPVRVTRSLALPSGQPQSVVERLF